MTAVQRRRALATSTAGISLTTWLQFQLMGFFWMAYGIAIASWPVALGAVVCMPFQMTIVLLLRPWTQMRVVARSVTFIGLFCFAPTLLWGWSAGVLGYGRGDGHQSPSPDQRTLAHPRRHRRLRWLVDSRVAL
jgi:hypothetical protein